MTTTAITPLRQRMVEDMNARKLCAGIAEDDARDPEKTYAALNYLLNERR